MDEKELEKQMEIHLTQLEDFAKEAKEKIEAERVARKIQNVDDALKEKSKQNHSIIKKCIDMQETMRNESENSSKL